MKRQPIQSFALKDLSFAYPNGSPLFSEITIDMPKAKAVWIRSPGGWGKSTLLRLLFGLQQPSQGAVIINGQDITKFSFEQFLSYRLNMGYSFDMGGLLNNKTLNENLMLQLQYHNMTSDEDAQERVTLAFEMFGIMAKQHQRPYAVSGSVRKLTCILRAFMHWPQVVFLDDPLTGLNEDNIKDLMHFIQEGFANRGLKQIFFTSENPILAQTFKAEELLISMDWFTTRAVA